MREKFELWAKAEGLINESFGIRSVNEEFLNACWKAWQASRAAIEISMPPTVITAEVGPAVSLEKMTARLAVNGIKVKSDEQRNSTPT